MELTIGWSYEVDCDAAGGLAHGAGLARGDGVEPFQWLHFLGRRARLDGFLYAVDFFGSSPPSSPSLSPASFGGRGVRAFEALMIGGVTNPADCRFGTVGRIMVCWTITRGTVAVSLDPHDLLGGF